MFENMGLIKDSCEGLPQTGNNNFMTHSPMSDFPLNKSTSFISVTSKPSHNKLFGIKEEDHPKDQLDPDSALPQKA